MKTEVYSLMKGKIESVQMMRGIAALSVVICHLGILKGREVDADGYFGVDLFFCISGFIMMFVTEKSCDGFLFKRFLRICPLYYLLTIAAFATAFIAPHLLRDASTEFDALARSFFFIGGNDIMVGVGWTLCYEMFFYGLFFIAFKINHKNRHIISTAFLAILVLAGIIFEPENAYLNFYTRPILLEFALGMFAYKILYHSKIYNSNNAYMQYVCLLLAIIVYTSLFFITFDADRLFSAGIPTFVAFLLFFKALENKKMTKPLIILGNISYSLYLTHTFVITISQKLLWDIEPEITFSSVAVSLFAVSMTIVTAYISWYLIENKLTEWIRVKLKK